MDDGADVYGQDDDADGEDSLAAGSSAESAGANATQDPSDALFSQPSHVLPPMSALVTQFLDTVLAKRTDGPGVGAEGEDDDADSVVGDDEDADEDADSDDDVAADPSVKETRVVMPTFDTQGADELAAAKPQQFDFMVGLFAKSAKAANELDVD